jgi:hypothetical protein
MTIAAKQLLEPLNTEIGHAVLGLQILEIVYISARGQALMQRAAPGFFAVTSIALQREVFLAMARLTDPPRTGKFGNITLRTLVESLPPSIDEAYRTKLTGDVSAIEKLAAPIRDWRMKYLAHSDIAHGVGLTPPLQTISITVVRDVAERAGGLVEEIWHLLSPHAWKDPRGANQAGGGRRLLRVLEQGLVEDDGYQERD